MSTNIRKQVMAAIVGCMSDAIRRGDNPFDAAQREFPGTPGGVLGEALYEAESAEEEAWWQTIERTIDGEVIRNAIAGAVPS
jgi:hypothetical protein